MLSDRIGEYEASPRHAEPVRKRLWYCLHQLMFHGVLTEAEVMRVATRLSAEAEKRAKRIAHDIDSA